MCTKVYSFYKLLLFFFCKLFFFSKVLLEEARKNNEVAEQVEQEEKPKDKEDDDQKNKEELLPQKDKEDDDQKNKEELLPQKDKEEEQDDEIVTALIQHPVSLKLQSDISTKIDFPLIQSATDKWEENKVYMFHQKGNTKIGICFGNDKEKRYFWLIDDPKFCENSKRVLFNVGRSIKNPADGRTKSYWPIFPNSVTLQRGNCDDVVNFAENNDEIHLMLKEAFLMHGKITYVTYEDVIDGAIGKLRIRIDGFCEHHSWMECLST